jgi:hypothetical protein
LNFKVKKGSKMKKILSITLISALTLLFSTGCGGTTATVAAPEASQATGHNDPKVSSEALYVETHNNKKIAHAIKKAGEATGWKITEFKNNEVIAEKTLNEETVSSNIKFSQGHIEFSDNATTSDLRDAIKEELAKESSAH